MRCSSDEATVRVHSGQQAEWHVYVGVTSNVIQRVWQHKNNFVEGFTKRYGVHMLVWYEKCGTMDVAIAREKAIKETCVEDSPH